MNLDIALEPQTYSVRQQLLARFFVAVLIDLTVLNLFAEYWSHVVVMSFTTSLWTAILLQAVFGVTLRLEKMIGSFFLRRRSAAAVTQAMIAVWLVAFLMKVAALNVIDVMFGDRLFFTGSYMGTFAFLTVVFTMLLTEALVRRAFLKLG